MPYTGGSADANPIYGPTAINTDDLRAVDLADAGRGIDPTGVGGGGGITAAEANTALSAGGSDPITNLGAATPFYFTGDGGIAFTGNGSATGAAGPGQFSFLDSAAGINYATSTNLLTLTSNAGTGGYPRIDISPDDAGFAAGGIVLSDGNQNKRLTAYNDGTGVTLYDADAAKISDWLEYDAGGGNIGRQFTIYDGADATKFAVDNFTGGATAATSYNADGSGYSSINGDFIIVHLGTTDVFKMEGSGVLGGVTPADGDVATWVDADGTVQWLAGGKPATYYSDGGDDPITALATQLAGTAWNDGSFDRVKVDALGNGVVVLDSAGIDQHNIGDTLVGFFAANPYGQDAYLAPLNESVSITLLTDVAALLDEERARINDINAYLIARGWEAAA